MNEQWVTVEAEPFAEQTISIELEGIESVIEVEPESIGGSPASPYEGSYEITPTTETQTLLTQGLLSTDNFTINPIPENYGLITWNGSILTVS